nr:IS3 family transposase [Streptomyces brevispora]
MSRPARTVRERAEEVLVGEIRVLHAGSRGAYGAPRIHAALRRAGRVVNSKKVERLMRKHRIAGITRRRRGGLARQAKRAVFALDLIGRDFTAPRPGMRLVGDMTELGTLEGKLYLATCIDLATREVVGWAMADHHRAEPGTAPATAAVTARSAPTTHRPRSTVEYPHPTNGRIVTPVTPHQHASTRSCYEL